MSSQGFRQNPLAIQISTAGFNVFGFCHKYRDMCINILHGLSVDDGQFSAIYELDDEDRWDDEEKWVKANPNLDVTVSRKFLREQIRMAKNNSSLEVGVRTKNLNQWLSSSDIWLSNDLLLQSTQKVNLDDYEGLTAYVGVDLAAVSDLTAVALMIPIDGKYIFKTKYYLPSSTLDDNSNSELYRQWKRMGYLTITDGNVTDYDYIVNDLKKANEKVIIGKVAYDSWNATQWAITATAEGLPLEPFSQSLGNFNRPTKEFERLLKSGNIIIDDNEITRYCFSNVIMKYDYNENAKPSKGENQNKIDGVIALIEALGIYLAEPQYNNEIMSL
jgi:phage terminase large subunit-like protein